MSTFHRSWIRRSVPMFVVVAALMAGSCSVEVEAPSTSPTLTDPVGTQAPTSTPSDATNIPDSPIEDDMDFDFDDAGSDDGVFMTLDDQTTDFEPTSCEVDSGNVTLVGPGTERDSGDDAYLDMKITKPDNFSEGTVTLILGSKSSDGAGDKLVAQVGDGSPYMVTTVDQSATVQVDFEDSAGGSVGTAEFTINCD